jgi:hypothetical protein
MLRAPCAASRRFAPGAQCRARRPNGREPSETVREEAAERRHRQNSSVRMRMIEARRRARQNEACVRRSRWPELAVGTRGPEREGQKRNTSAKRGRPRAVYARGFPHQKSAAARRYDRHRCGVAQQLSTVSRKAPTRPPKFAGGPRSRPEEPYRVAGLYRERNATSREPKRATPVNSLTRRNEGTRHVRSP